MWQGGQDQSSDGANSIDYYRRVATFMGDGEANSPPYSRGSATIMLRASDMRRRRRTKPDHALAKRKNAALR